MKDRGWRQGLVGSGVGLLWGWADAAEMHPTVRGGGRVGAGSPTALPGQGFSGCCCSEKNLCLIRRQICEKQSRGSGWAPRKTAR